jgi:hypothetical protein
MRRRGDAVTDHATTIGLFVAIATWCITILVLLTSGDMKSPASRGDVLYLQMFVAMFAAYVLHALRRLP